MRAVIFANGDLNKQLDPGSLLKPDDILIAADGGATYMQTLHLLPQAAIGDFDSLDEASLEALEKAGVKILRYPARKDETDLELALRYADSLGVKEILILGALGNRWDQTLANILLPAAGTFSDLNVRLVDGYQEMTLVRTGQTLQLDGQTGDTLSLIPLAGDATGITTQGLEYPLKGETLSVGSTRGVSNVLLGNYASVSLDDGMILCVLIHRLNREETDEK